MTKKQDKKEILYTKEQLMEAKEFQTRKDLVNALVADEEQISKEKLSKRIKTFLEGRVG